MNENKIYTKKIDGGIAWSTLEFPYHEKNKNWIISFWIISFGIFLSLIISKNIFGAATIAMFSVVIYIYATKKPEIIECEINKSGIIFSERLFPFSEISYFWISHDDIGNELIVKSSSSLIPRISIPLGEVDPNEVKTILQKNKINEVKASESLSDTIAKRLRF